jgi:hypothetical protein
MQQHSTRVQLWQVLDELESFVRSHSCGVQLQSAQRILVAILISGWWL